MQFAKTVLDLSQNFLVQLRYYAAIICCGQKLKILVESGRKHQWKRGLTGPQVVGRCSQFVGQPKGNVSGLGSRGQQLGSIRCWRKATLACRGANVARRGVGRCHLAVITKSKFETAVSVKYTNCFQKMKCKLSFTDEEKVMLACGGNQPDYCYT